MPLHLYLTISERKFYRKVYNTFSEDRHRKQTITFFATYNYNPIFHYKYKLTTFFFKKERQTRAQKAGEFVRFRIEENSFIFELF